MCIMNRNPGKKLSLKYDYELDSEEEEFESESSEDAITQNPNPQVFEDPTPQVVADVPEVINPQNSNLDSIEGCNYWIGRPPRSMLRHSYQPFHQQRHPRPRFAGPPRPSFRHPYVPYGNMPIQNVQYHSSGSNNALPFAQIPGFAFSQPLPQYQQNIAFPYQPQAFQRPRFVNAPNKLQGYAPYGIPHHKIKEICDALDEKKILVGSADLLKGVVQDETFYRRLDNLWEEFDTDKRIDFLRIISAAAAISHNEFRHSIHEFMNKILMSTLIDTIVGQISQIPYNPAMQIPIYGKLIQYMAEIMLAGFELIPSQMSRHLLKVQNLIFSAEMPLTDFLSPETKELIEKLKKVYEDAQKSKAQQAQNLMNVKKVKQRHFEGSLGEPPTDFRQLSIIPTPADLNPNYRPYLRVAKFKGRYESDEHYLDVQFRLLREDLIQPLRMGIADYKAGNPDIFIYKNVKLDEPSLHPASGNFIHYANFQMTRQIEYGKAMKHNSLLCLSPDNFEEIFLFAIVQDRNVECLKKGKIGIKFESDEKIDTSVAYNIVESPAFFEAYRHVMATLQCNQPGIELPFSNYLVNVSTYISPPKYLRHFENHQINKEIKFDCSCLLTESAKEKTSKTLFNPYDLEEMLPDQFGMNEYQYQAFLFFYIGNLYLFKALLELEKVILD